MKEQILNNLCYTELVYDRIRKKLVIDLSDEEIEKLILKIIKETDEKDFVRIGKNYYVLNIKNNIRITINSNTFRVITVM